MQGISIKLSIYTTVSTHAPVLMPVHIHIPASKHIRTMLAHIYLHACPQTHTPLHIYLHAYMYISMLVCSYCTRLIHLHIPTQISIHTPLHMSVQHSHMFTYLHTFLCTLMYLYVVLWGPMTSLREALSTAYLGEGFVGDRGVDIRTSGPS